MRAKPPSPDLQAQFETNLTLGWSPDQILTADKGTLQAMQHRLGLGSTWGQIEIPKTFMPAGHGQYDSRRIHTLSQCLPAGMATDSPVAEQIWTEILRYAATRLTQLGPKFSEPGKYSSLASDLAILKPRLRPLALMPTAPGTFWSRIELGGTRSTDSLYSVIRRFHDLGALPDAPRRATPTITGDEPERNRQDELESEAPVNRHGQWQPLTLPFVAQMGWRSVRLVRIIAPALLDAIETALQIPAVTHYKRKMEEYPYSADMSEMLTSKRRATVIAEWNWRDPDGQPIDGYGFEFSLGDARRQFTWPPKTLAEAMTIAHALIKPAHLWMVLLGNGNRNSEAVSMLTGCLVEAADGNFKYMNKTYKMTGLNQGKEVDAIVPELITQSILQQARLARLTGLHNDHAGKFLWVGYKKNTLQIKNLNDMLNQYVKVLGLRELLGPENPSCHEHRFRKTVAYLVATTLTNAIMVVKDCFGHKDDMMSLVSYILSDPDIAREVIQVQKEMTILMARDALLDLDNLAGPGAAGIKERAREHLTRKGKNKFEPQDAYEFARVETFDGRTWMLVGPGILCTAPHGMTQMSTPCAIGQKRHNPSRCKAGCDWQVLLTGHYMTHADDTIQYTVDQLQRAADDDDEAMTVFWQGQLNTWLYRYEKVTEKWKDHPLVKRFAKPPKATIPIAQEAA